MNPDNATSGHVWEYTMFKVLIFFPCLQAALLSSQVDFQVTMNNYKYYNI